MVQVVLNGWEKCLFNIALLVDHVHACTMYIVHVHGEKWFSKLSNFRVAKDCFVLITIRLDITAISLLSQQILCSCNYKKKLVNINCKGCSQTCSHY